MSEPAPAKFCFLTAPEPGVFLLNVQEEGEEIRRWQLNRDQLFNLNSQTADILKKAFK